MEKTAHTPGPWTAECPYGSNRIKVTAGRTTICDVGFELMAREVDQENAALIAAAPETARRLAEAEALLRDFVFAVDVEASTKRMSDLADAARVTLAKQGAEARVKGLEKLKEAKQEATEYTAKWVEAELTRAGQLEAAEARIAALCDEVVRAQNRRDEAEARTRRLEARVAELEDTVDESQDA